MDKDMEKDMEKIYKVVFKTISGRLHSARTRYPKFDKEYFLGEWVYPNIGKLFAFSTLWAAKDFCCADDRIYVASAKGITICEQMGDILDPRYWEDFWSGKIVPREEPLNNTVCCDAIKLELEVC